MHHHKADPQPNRQANGHRYELQRCLEAGEIGRGGACRLLRGKGKEAAVPEPGGQLEENPGDLRAIGD